jgi:threonine/homoserine/homoserine lactone efflux protein
MLNILVSGLVIGILAGISPGPLMSLVIGESLRGGWPAGFRVSLAPLVTDSVFMVIALVVVAPLPIWGLNVISVVGGLLIMGMGWSTARASAPSVQAEKTGRGAFRKGVVTNLFNPTALLFWVTAGGSLLHEAYLAAGWFGPASFLTGFFATSISINMVIAYGISRGRGFLNGEGYRWSLRVVGLMVGLFGVWRLYLGLSGLIG